MNDPEIVAEEESPHRNLEAIVEQDDRVAYLYLIAREEPGIGFKSLWLRNLAPAPEVMDLEGMRNGIPPMLPREHCKHPAGKEALDASRLRFVWLPEGDGVAVMEDDEILGMIPPWGVIGDFPGYSRDATGESGLCWGLEDPAIIQSRISDAERFWQRWDEGESQWSECQNSMLEVYDQVWGPYTNYFAIDGKKWPPKALIRTKLADVTYLATLGISLRPQPQVEMHCEDPRDYRRFEFATCFDNAVANEIVKQFASYLSGQSSLPWAQFTFLGHGHTIRCETFSLDPSLRRFTAVLLLEQPATAPKIDLPFVAGEKVRLLWAIPITADEQAFCEKEGSMAFLKRFPESWPLHRIGNRPLAKI